jgi:thiol-disulfide isomerase/thioredoxin
MADSLLVVCDPLKLAELIQTQERLLVYFWGHDCPNCEIFARHFEQLKKPIEELGVRIAKINAYDYPDCAVEFGLRGIPAFFLYQDGKRLGRMSDFESDDYFMSVLKENFGTPSSR